MENGLPAARQPALDIFRTIVQINDVCAAATGHFLHRGIDFRIRLHRADLVGINVAVEVFEERKVPLDVLDGKVIGIGEDVGFETAPAQFRVERDHGRDFGEDVREITAEFREAALETNGVADFFKKLLPGDLAIFVLDDQGRAAQKGSQVEQRFRAAGCNFAGGYRIIEIHQHLAKIKDDDF